MSSTTQEQLLRFFREAGGTDVSETPAANQVAESSNGPLAEAAAGAVLGPASDAADGQGYAATPVGTSSEGGAESAQSTGGTGSMIESALTTFLEGGLGIVPLVSGLIGLFDGGSSAPPQLEKYQKPSSIDFVSADTPNLISQRWVVSAASSAWTAPKRVRAISTVASDITQRNSSPPMRTIRS